MGLATNDDSHSFSRTAKLRDRVEPRRFVMGDRPSTLRSLEKISSKQRMGWAKASGLVTTRTLIDRDKKLSTEAEKRKYLDSPIPNENFPSSVSKMLCYSIRFVFLFFILESALHYLVSTPKRLFN